MTLDKHLNELQKALDKGVVKAMELYVQDEAGYVRNPWLTKGDKIVGQIEDYESLYGVNFVYRGSLMELRNRGKQGLYQPCMRQMTQKTRKAIPWCKMRLIHLMSTN